MYLLLKLAVFFDFSLPISRIRYACFMKYIPEFGVTNTYNILFSGLYKVEKECILQSNNNDSFSFVVMYPSLTILIFRKKKKKKCNF